MISVKLLFMDVDGTLTDGKIYMGQDGEAMKAFDVKDGCGIHDILPRYGIIPVIITARTSVILANRCRELDIKHVCQGCADKKEKMCEIAGRYGIVLDEKGILPGTAYIGDDILDIPCMELAEYSACPGDAVQAVKEKSTYLSEFSGGNGAVRDFIEWIVGSRTA